jgi:hypothetical protein
MPKIETLGIFFVVFIIMGLRKAVIGLDEFVGRL